MFHPIPAVPKSWEKKSNKTKILPKALFRNEMILLPGHKKLIIHRTQSNTPQFPLVLT